jgi:hypothetical protein
VEISSGIQASLAGRYATALFELARDERQLEAVGTSLAHHQPADRPRRRAEGGAAVAASIEASIR